MKKILSVIICLIILASTALPAFAAGDPNIDTGGSGLGNGSEGNIWYGDSGVRVTMGTKYGVVKTQLSERSWTAWLEIPYISYITETEETS